MLSANSFNSANEGFGVLPVTLPLSPYPLLAERIQRARGTAGIDVVHPLLLSEGLRVRVPRDHQVDVVDPLHRRQRVEVVPGHELVAVRNEDFEALDVQHLLLGERVDLDERLRSPGRRGPS